MKIDINKLKVVPKSLTHDFKLCVYGLPDQEVLSWIKENNLSTEKVDNYTNIIIPETVDLNDLFIKSTPYEYMDGFSPNLNKNLHIGHFSNLVIAKAFKSLGICNNLVSIYGDTLDGQVKKEDAIKQLQKYQNDFNFYPDKEFFASEVKYDGDLLKDGTDDYLGTKIFEIENEKIVAIKSNGQTTYFYQDVALAQILNSSTIYLTGKEQNNHFLLLKKLYPHINHIGLGLVKASGAKMASRLGNVIFMEDFLEHTKELFEDNIKLTYNVFAGFILKSNPDIDKSINMDLITNPKNSSGLYISYTMARLISAGCEKQINDSFNSRELQFAYLKAKYNLKPNILFDSLVESCKKINLLYNTHRIQGNDENKILFENHLSDLIYGSSKLGLYVIDKV